MKRLIMALAVLAGLTGAAEAKNFAVPSNNPAVTLQIPDAWETEKIDFGFKASEPDEDIILYVESTKTTNAEALGRLNVQWMKEQKIGVISKIEREVTYGGLPGQAVRYKAKDSDGDTNVTFIYLPAGTDRFIQLTVWGDDEAEQKHSATLTAIFNSIKAIQ